MAQRNLDDLFIMDLLEEIMDEQFDTKCQDNSIPEVSRAIFKLFSMVKIGNLEGMFMELSQLPPCEHWIKSSFRPSQVRRESSSSSDDDDDVPPPPPGSNGNKMDVEDDDKEKDPDPGWTLVGKKKHK